MPNYEGAWEQIYIDLTRAFGVSEKESKFPIFQFLSRDINYMYISAC